MEEDDTLHGPHAALAELVVARATDGTLRVFNLSGETGSKAMTDSSSNMNCDTWESVERFFSNETSSSRSSSKASPSLHHFCWHDGHAIVTAPTSGKLLQQQHVFFLPVAHDDLRDYFWVFGRFCSLSCAAKFAMDRAHLNGKQIYMLIQIMAVKLYGMTHAEATAPGGVLTPAPCRQSLRYFGNLGPTGMTIDQFRNREKSGLHQSSTCYRKPPFLTTDNVNFEVRREGQQPQQQHQMSYYQHILLYKAFSEKAPYVMICDFVGWSIPEYAATAEASAAASSAAASPIEMTTCWHDMHEIPADVLPVGIPLAIEEDDDGVLLFSMFGYFCSGNCALAYIEEMRDWNSGDQAVYVHRFCHEVLRVPNTVIVEPAEPAYELTRFGGEFEITKFRDLFCATATFLRCDCHRLLDPSRHRVRWVNTAIEYQTFSLPSVYASLRSLGVMGATGTPTASNEKRQILKEQQQQPVRPVRRKQAATSAAAKAPAAKHNTLAPSTPYFLEKLMQIHQGIVPEEISEEIERAIEEKVTAKEAPKRDRKRK